MFFMAGKDKVFPGIMQKAASLRPQATSYKLQAASYKQFDISLWLVACGL
jgi:hypothetical protein